jgi:hypothetical protein
MTTQTDSNTTTADAAAPMTTANARELIAFAGAADGDTQGFGWYVGAAYSE